MTAVELLRRDRHRPAGRSGWRLPISGALKRDWVVKIGEDYLQASILEGMISIPMEIDLSIEGGKALTVSSDWRPGDAIWLGTVGERSGVAAQIRPVANGLRIAWKGMSVTARAMLPRTAELERLMPEKVAPDTSNLLLCPMPGLVVSIAVVEGQEVKAGETLAVVEAMKMENVLRAERDLVVLKLNAKPERQPGCGRRDHGIRLSLQTGIASVLFVWLATYRLNTLLLDWHRPVPDNIISIDFQSPFRTARENHGGRQTSAIP